jgi:membrane-bound lytic murein transglycosylase D
MEEHILKFHPLNAHWSKTLASVGMMVALTLTACSTVPLYNDQAPTSSTSSNTNPALTAPNAKTATEASARKSPSAPAAVPPNATRAANAALSPLSQTDLVSPQVTHLNLPADLWERIRRGFAMPALESDLVLERQQWYAARPDYLTRATERSNKYLYYIVQALEERKMPTELALLPFVESAFNPQAVSSAKASGMWQFMPKTGKNFALQQNAFRDDRRDVMASTQAALDYLQKLHGQFGDWHLALAAYNWGEGNVARAIAKNQRLGQSAGYLDLNMPMETRMYVPKLQALVNIVARPQVFGVTLSEAPNHPYFQSVPLTRDIDVSLAAKLAEVALEDFKALNPSASRPVLLAAGTPQILLPWDNAEVFQKNFEAYSGTRLASWTAWIAPTTLKVADAAKRIGMSESELRALNAIPPKMLIKAGSALLVPRGLKKEEDVTQKVADQGQLELAPEIITKRVSFKVSKKDSWASLSKRYKVSMEQLAALNHLSPHDKLKPGQTLSVEVSVKAMRSGPAKNHKSAERTRKA